MRKLILISTITALLASLALVGAVFAGSGVPAGVQVNWAAGTLTVSGNYTCNDINDQGLAVFAQPATGVNGPDATGNDSLQNAGTITTPPGVTRTSTRGSNTYDLTDNCTAKGVKPFTLTYTGITQPADGQRFCLVVYHRKQVNGSIGDNIKADGPNHNTDNSFENRNRTYLAADCGTIPTIRTQSKTNGSASAAGTPTDSFTDTATIAGAPANLAGTVTFTAYKNSATCDPASLAFTSTKSFNTGASGGGSVTSDPMGTPVPKGDYLWIASFSSGSFTLAGHCGDANENTTVTPPSTPTKTGQKVTIHDQAHIDGFIAGGSAATVDFRLYDDLAACQNTSINHIVYSALGVPVSLLSSNPSVYGGDSGNFGVSPTVNTTYYWNVQFSGNNVNNASTSLCTESFSINGNDFDP